MAQAHVTENDIDLVYRQINAACAAGNEDEGVRLMKTIPLEPALALAAKQAFGVEYLRLSGFDLSAAEAEYGKDWLLR